MRRIEQYGTIPALTDQEVHPNLQLSILDLEFHDNVQVKIPLWDHPLQFVLLSGITRDDYGGLIGEGYTLISGSGIQHRYRAKPSRLDRAIERTEERRT